MPQTTIAARIDALFDDPDSANSEWLRVFVAQLHERHIAAEHAWHTQASAFAIAWLATFAIGAGLVSEGEVGIFRVQQIQNLLIVAPTLLGFLAYSLGAATCLSMVLRDALAHCYRRALPKAHQENLESFICATNFLGAEQLTESGALKLETVFNHLIYILLAALVFLGGLVAIFHSLGLVEQVTAMPRSAIVGVGFVGIVFWFRGVLMVTYAIRI